jgi:hypothetical protein
MDFSYFQKSEKPKLVEPGIKYFLNESLKKCHEVKEVYHTYIFNLGLFFLFVIILACILIYKYKGKLTPVEKREKEIKTQNYILSRIKNFEISKKKARDELITGLPSWENEVSAYHTKLVY